MIQLQIAGETAEQLRRAIFDLALTLGIVTRPLAHDRTGRRAAGGEEVIRRKYSGSAYPPKACAFCRACRGVIKEWEKENDYGKYKNNRKKQGFTAYFSAQSAPGENVNTH